MTFKRTALAVALSHCLAFSVTATEPPPLAVKAAEAPAPTQAPATAPSVEIAKEQAPSPTPLPVVPAATTPAPTPAVTTPAAPTVPAPAPVADKSTDKEKDKPPAPVAADAETSTTLKEVVVANEKEKEPGAPVVVFDAGTVLPVAPPTDLWDRIRAGHGIPDLDDEYVRKWEQFYAGKPDYLQRIVERAGKYMFYIVTETERRGMPLEVALLPMVESAFVPHAMSSAAAAGIWQFIPSTGKNFGMKQDWWADSRRDIVAGTQGALDYLQKLYGMFGDWQLALAAYNWGEGSVQRALNANRAAGKGVEYVSLNMPNETRNYLPKLQAVKNILSNPSAFGLSIPSIPNQPYFKTITLARHIDVDRAIKLARVSKEEFLALNPAHNRPVIGGRESHQILLPADSADTFIMHLEADDRPMVSWMAYKTKGGDTLNALATRFGLTVDALRAVNGIRNVPPALPPGYNLLVPSSGPSEEALGSLQNAVFTKLPEYAPGPVLPTIHRVAKRETLATVAKRYGVTVQKLQKWNMLGKQTAVRPGALLAVSGPMPMQTRLVRVKKGGRYVMVRQTVPAIRVASGKKGKAGKFVLAKNNRAKARGKGGAAKPAKGKKRNR
jgi:membrane-bound lytic murein transglycosylase D